MTERQQQLLKLVALGLNNHEIAETIGVTYNATKKRVQDLFDLTGMSNRVELALWYWKHADNAQRNSHLASSSMHRQLDSAMVPGSVGLPLQRLPSKLQDLSLLSAKQGSSSRHDLHR